jgi:hypothetical protein
MKKLGGSMLLGLIMAGGMLFLGCGKAQALPPLPDLTVALKPGPLTGQIIVGQDISSLVNIQVKNIGLSAVSSYAVAVVLSTNSTIVYSPNPHASITTGRMIGQRVVSKSLPPGASEVISIKPVRIPDDISWGNYFITVIVDPGNKVVESNESNNSAQAGLFIMADASLIEQYYDGAGVFAHFHGKGFGSWKSTIVARVGTYSIPTSSQHWSGTCVQAYPAASLIPVGTQLYDVGLYDGTKAICLTQKKSWGIFLTSAAPASGPSGTTVQVMCLNCQAQGTKKLVLHNQNYQFAGEVPVVSWSNGQIVGTIPNVMPGNYFVMVTDGGQLITSGWIVTFTVI